MIENANIQHWSTPMAIVGNNCMYKQFANTTSLKCKNWQQTELRSTKKGWVGEFRNKLPPITQLLVIPLSDNQ